MGTVYAGITLKNAFDVTNAQRGIIGAMDIRQTEVQAVVDTGSMTLIISDEVRQQLGLEMRGTKITRMANNAKAVVNVTEAVEVHWKNRSMICQPWVMPDCDEVLLGVIPLEDMDLMVDPTEQVLVGAHGDEIQGIQY
ncbi:MAG: aspartyl protease family protein [Treponema sp.]|jgi:clan AA aspartic protease|nr:aspartyl protease family protein [Treponema sp.]